MKVQNGWILFTKSMYGNSIRIRADKLHTFTYYTDEETGSTRPNQHYIYVNNTYRIFYDSKKSTLKAVTKLEEILFGDTVKDVYEVVTNT